MKWNLEHVSSLYARARAVPRTAPAPVAVTIPAEIVAEAPEDDVRTETESCRFTSVRKTTFEGEEEHGESN
jgi:hypothetical protein